MSLSIKDVPDRLAKALRERARQNHRSIQGELMDILEQTLQPRPFRARDFVREIRALGIKTPSDSVQMIREDRDR